MKSFDNSQFEKYKAEVKEKWGATDAYQEHAHKTKDYSKQQWQNVNDGLNHIFADFSICMKNGHAPDSSEAQSLVEQLQAYITVNYYTCTKQILAGLGQMYVADERFRNNIDQNGDGTAAFVGEAIEIFCRA